MTVAFHFILYEVRTQNKHECVQFPFQAKQRTKNYDNRIHKTVTEKELLVMYHMNEMYIFVAACESLKTITNQTNVNSI